MRVTRTDVLLSGIIFGIVFIISMLSDTKPEPIEQTKPNFKIQTDVVMVDNGMETIFFLDVDNQTYTKEGNIKFHHQGTTHIVSKCFDIRKRVI